MQAESRAPGGFSRELDGPGATNRRVGEFKRSRRRHKRRDSQWRLDYGNEARNEPTANGHVRWPRPLPLRLSAVGSYMIAVDSRGFDKLARQLTLTVGQAVELQLRLTVGGVSESVQVAADIAVVETARTQLAETVLPREIDSLPLNGRNYLDLAALTPGVTRNNPSR